jgi:hypothetical protein
MKIIFLTKSVLEYWPLFSKKKDKASNFIHLIEVIVE